MRLSEIGSIDDEDAIKKAGKFRIDKNKINSE